MVKCHTIDMGSNNQISNQNTRRLRQNSGNSFPDGKSTACSMSRAQGVSIPLGNLVEGRLISRPNRFLAVVDLAGQTIQAHVPDPGRLEELLFPENRVMVRNISAQLGSIKRKTQYDLVLAGFNNIWVCVDTRYPNRLFEQAATKGTLGEFREYTSVHREVALDQVSNRLNSRLDNHVRNHLSRHLGTHDRQDDTEGRNTARESEGKSGSKTSTTTGKGNESPAKDNSEPRKTRKTRNTPKSRFDFMLEGPGKRPLLVEVKSVTLCIDGTGLFPDAPTERGARHLRELKEISSMGLDTCVVFIAQREDITSVSANREMDPGFAQALDEAAQAGVKILAYRCCVSPYCIRLSPEPIPYQQFADGKR